MQVPVALVEHPLVTVGVDAQASRAAEAVALGVAEATPTEALEYLQLLLAHLLLTDRAVRVGPLIAEPVVERATVFPEHLPEELSLPIELHNLLFFDTR
jgi:hypothetical protein